MCSNKGQAANGAHAKHAQATATSIRVASCLGVFCLVHDNIEFNYYIKVFHHVSYLERQIEQDEALYKCHWLLLEDPALQTQPRHKVPVGVGVKRANGRQYCRTEHSLPWCTSL